MSTKSKIEIIFIFMVGISCIGIALLFTKFYKGGSIIVDGNIDEKAFSLYAKVCEGQAKTESFDDSTNFIKETTEFDLFSPTPPKVLVIDSNGSAYISGKGLGGGWNPQRLYDVQLVVCMGEKHSSPDSESFCNENSNQTYQRTLKVYEAKTGEVQLSAVLRKCSNFDQTSLENIKQELADNIKSRQSMYQWVP